MLYSYSSITAYRIPENPILLIKALILDRGVETTVVETEVVMAKSSRVIAVLLPASPLS